MSGSHVNRRLESALAHMSLSLEATFAIKTKVQHYTYVVAGTQPHLFLLTASANCKQQAKEDTVEVVYLCYFSCFNSQITLPFHISVSCFTKCHHVHNFLDSCDNLGSREPIIIIFTHLNEVSLGDRPRPHSWLHVGAGTRRQVASS